MNVTREEFIKKMLELLRKDKKQWNITMKS